MTYENIEEYLVHGAKIMSADRNDLWPTPEDALRRLRNWVSILDEYDETSSVSSGAFQLTKAYDEEGNVEWNLFRHVLDFYGDGHGFDWNLKTN